MEKEIELLEKEALQVATKFKESAIKNDADYITATEYLKEVKTKAKEIEEFFKPLKENAHKSWKAICDKENTYKKPLVDAENKLKGLMIDFQSFKEIERKKIEAEALRLQEKEIAKLEKKGKTEEAEALSNQSIEVVDNTSKVEGVSYQVDYEIIITNEDEVPVSINGILIRPVDLAIVKKLAKESKGKIKIDGIKIVETKIAKVRI